MGLIDQLPYVHALGDGGPRATTTCVVLHATDNTASASNEATYASHRPDKTSAHLYVDTGACIRALPLDHIAYGCLRHGNQISVQIEMVGRSNAIPDATMRRAAECVAEICQRYGIPIRKISARDVANGVKGIVGHADITAAFPQDRGDHTDPGSAFPWNTFIGYVQAAAGTPAPTPPPTGGLTVTDIDTLNGKLDLLIAATGVPGKAGVRNYQAGPILDGVLALQGKVDAIGTAQTIAVAVAAVVKSLQTTLAPDQLGALTTAVSQAVAAHADTPLGEQDKPAIEEAVEVAVRHVLAKGVDATPSA